MPIFDYQVTRDVPITFSRNTGSLPTGGDAHSLNVNIPTPTPLTQVMLKRLRGGLQRGSHELQFAVLPQAGGAGGSGGVFLGLQSSLGNKRFVKDPRDAKGYVLSFDATTVGKVNFQDSIRPTAKVFFSGTGLNSSPVGPGNWYRMLIQLQHNADGTFVLRVRQSATAVNAPAVWTRVTSLPDITYAVSEALDPGWCGLFAFGTTGDLVRFNHVLLSNTLTSL